MIRRQWITIGLLTGLGLLSAACSNETNKGNVVEGDPLLVRLQLEPVAKPSAAELTVIDTIFPPPADASEELAWQTAGGKRIDGMVAADPTVTEHYPGSKEVAGVWKVPVVVAFGEGKKTVAIPGDFDPQAFNTIGVRLLTDKQEAVTIVCKRNGKPVASSDAQFVSASREVKGALFVVPRLRRIQKEFDVIELRFNGEAVSSAVAAIELIKQPMASLLPSADAPELVPVRPDLMELRRGSMLSSENGLRTQFEVAPGSELAFSYMTPDAWRTKRAAPALRLTIEDSAGTKRSKTFALEDEIEQKSKWHDGAMDLTAFNGKAVRATFELELKGRNKSEAFCIVAEPRMRRGGTNAKTVLLITSDTHRADHLGLGDENAPVQTPNLDALAARGIQFDNCYSATNVTNPSHIALMTATHVRDTRITNNHSPLADSAQTLAEHFQAAGYRTFAALSAHHLVQGESGLGQGYDRMSAPRRGDRDAVVTLDTLQGWLDDAEGEQVFIWLHLFDAHSPYGPPKPFDRKYYKGGDPNDPSIERKAPDKVFPPYMADLRDVDYPYAQYRAEVDYLDHELGRLFDQERFQNAVIAFTADHGESFGQHGVWWDHAELYPDNVHIPLIVSYPEAPAGTRTDAPVEQIDVGRTLLNLAGLEQAPFPGRDLRWALEESPAAEPRFVISAHRFSAAVNSGDWHLILHLRKHHQTPLETGKAHHQVELYNLAEDPGCLNDVVDAEFERAKRMRAALIKWFDDASATGFVDESATTTPEAQKSLEALGYADGGDTGHSDDPWFTPCTPPYELGVVRGEMQYCEWCPRFDDDE